MESQRQYDRPLSCTSEYGVAMRRIIPNASLRALIQAYKRLQSSYRVARLYGTSPTAVKRLLKEAGALRSQSEAARRRNLTYPNLFTYTRTARHRRRLSLLAKRRKGPRNPFWRKRHSREARARLREHAKRRAGRRNPNYRHGQYQRRPRDFEIACFASIRRAVFERDGFRCHYCRKRGGALVGHHMIPFWFSVGRRWVGRKAYLDPTNVVTVCVGCHRRRAHLGSWHRFDAALIGAPLLRRYKIPRRALRRAAAM
jgi:5-methylcytosine-specific restriction endonuclease McrA